MLIGAQGQNPLAGLGQQLSQNRAVNENILASEQNRGIQAQQAGIQQEQFQQQKAMQQLMFMNSMAKKMLNVDPSQWESMLTPYTQTLSEMGLDLRDLGKVTPEMLQGVIAQTDSALSGFMQESNIEQRKLDLRQEELRERQRVENRKAGELKPGVQKILNEAQDKAIESGARARQLLTLENDLLAAGDIGGGKGATFTEFLKQTLGTQDDVTELRRRYNAIRSSEAVQNLPPGVASDKDIELALKGFPQENAPKEQLVSFLRGARKMARIQEEYSKIKSRLISKKGSTRELIDEMESEFPEILKRIDAETSAQQSPQGVVDWSQL